jgi:hypothetical protein
MGLSQAAKQRLAIRYVAGTPLAELCSEFGLTEKEFHRLREGDSDFSAMAEEAIEVAWEEGCRLLRAQAQAAAKILRELAQLDPNNLEMTTGPNGGEVWKRKVDPHLVREQRRAAEKIVELWLEARRLKEREEARMQRLAGY